MEVFGMFDVGRLVKSLRDVERKREEEIEKGEPNRNKRSETGTKEIGIKEDGTEMKENENIGADEYDRT